MDCNFHHRCVRVLARSAGFNAYEADIIAYASQYTDHATEHKAIRIANMPAEAEPQAVRGTFEPTCTAHEALQYVTQWMSKDAQRKVYLSFHFVPPAPYASGSVFDFVVRPGAALALSLVTDALHALQHSMSGTTERLRNLIRTGIALHSYADTWAHQGFSGRWSPIDNDVQEREVWEGGEWKSLPLLTRLGLDIAPDVGHAELANLPDRSDLRFRYRKASDGAAVERDNTAEFLHAAEAIYELLRGCMRAPEAWPKLHPRVQRCLLDPTSWKSEFPETFDGAAAYDRMAWRRAALQGDRLDWDRMASESEFGALSFRATGDLKWFLFHVEAGKQRDFVLRNLGNASL